VATVEVETDVKYPGLLQPGPDDVLIDAVKIIIDQVEMEELTAQDKAVQEARRREFYWRGIQGVFWNEVAHKYDEIVPTTEAEAEALAKIVNVYRADGESIAAAVASSVPHVRFYPDDADNPDDITAAKAETRLSEKIAKDNEATMLMFQIMYTLWTEPFAAAYVCYVEDPSFGYRRVPVYEKQEGEESYKACAQCGMQLEPSSVLQANSSEPLGETDPAAFMGECPDCGPTETIDVNQPTEFPSMTGEVELPQGRAVIDIYGISHVRIPFYCRRQEDIGYVFLDTEQHYAMLRDIFPHIKKKILPGQVTTGMTQADYRRPIGSTREAEVSTIRRVWLRPWQFEVLDEDTHPEIAQLREKFPDGILTIWVNDVFAGAWADGIDKSWVFTKHPMSRYIHNIPIGDPELPIQDMTNEATNLFLDLILNSVPPQFVNPDTVNFGKLGNTRQLPGTWIKAKPKIPGTPLDSSFYTPKPPTMSQYLPSFFTMLDARRQHVVGAFPSIYGGPQAAGKTKGEYEQSRAQALQRLGIVWKMINIFWPKIMKLAVNQMRENMADDVKDVQRSGNDFVNVWIRKMEMTGKTGRVESESSEEFPVAWSQIRGILFELLGLGIPQVNEAILNVENIEFLKRVIGIPQLYIQGEDDRTYQLTVIQELIKSAPLMPGFPSIPPDDVVGDNDACIQVTQAWIMSEQGQEAKTMNPEGYANVVAHLQLRLMRQQQELMAQMEAESRAVPSPQGSKPAPQKGPSAGAPAVTV